MHKHAGYDIGHRQLRLGGRKTSQRKDIHEDVHKDEDDAVDVACCDINCAA